MSGFWKQSLHDAMKPQSVLMKERRDRAAEADVGAATRFVCAPLSVSFAVWRVCAVLECFLGVCGRFLVAMVRITCGVTVWRCRNGAGGGGGRQTAEC